jgi:hypothetical protein
MNVVFKAVRRPECRCLVLLCLLALPGTAHAVIVQGGHDVNGVADNSGRNLNAAPSGLSSYVGTFGNYLGTPIAPRYFITANHIGNGFLQNTGVGTLTYSNGTATPTVYGATLAGAQNDLAIWKIRDAGPAFSLYAPIYSGPGEMSQPLVVLGRGTARGSVVNSPTTLQPGGWAWGAADNATSWGTGTIADIKTVTTPGFGGDQLKWAFNFDAAHPDTSILSDGDSGGPVFVLNSTNSQYQLAGISGLVDQVSASSDPNGTNPLRDALYDARGFYSGTQQISDPQPVPLSSYASRLSSASGFINATLVPEPSTIGLMLVGVSGTLTCRRRSKVSATAL